MVVLVQLVPLPSEYWKTCADKDKRLKIRKDNWSTQRSAEMSSPPPGRYSSAYLLKWTEVGNRHPSTNTRRNVTSKVSSRVEILQEINNSVNYLSAIYTTPIVLLPVVSTSYHGPGTHLGGMQCTVPGYRWTQLHGPVCSLVV